ncbi:hypothetical protein [Thermococcus thermotolerans]|uniref:hypothetical protein n=1 Tax=Thermococcus thermotolerans TaxID=2969672 RepID=UPI0021579436|nr:hypothetical protein [Thermococcus thermotolerans]
MKRLVALIIALAVTASAVPSAAYEITPGVSVGISPNSELLSVVYYLAFGRDDPFVIHRGGYLDEVDAWFGPYRNHPAVTMLREHLQNATSISDRDRMLYYLEADLLQCTEPPELRQWAGFYDPWTSEYLGVLRDFAKKSNFMEFYRQHEDYYAEDINVYKGALEQLPPDDFMGDYIDVSNVRFEFQHPFLVAIHGHSFSPVRDGTQIYGAGGMVPLVRRDPQRTLWSHKTARDTVFGLPLNRDYINNTGLDRLIYLSFVYHELGHDTTVPGLNRYYEDTYSLHYLEDTIEGDMPYLATYDIHFWWDTMMIYEGFADGWADFALLHVDPDYSALAMWMQRGWGEFWIDDVLRIYEKYATLSQKNGVSIEEYVDDMLAELRKSVPPEVAEDMYQQRVPVTPLRAFDRGAVTGKVVVVYGTQNPDPRGTEYDRETAELIADNLRTFYSQWNGSVEIVVKADVNVTEDELGENLVLVGGPAANSVVAEMQEHFPLRFVKEGGHWVVEHGTNWSVESFIITENESDPVMKGRLDLSDDHNASLLVAVRNPSNPANYIVWIAGADRYGTRLFRNPTYYLSSYEIFTGKEIEMGFYVQPLSPS